ncbi:MAG: helix-turn-helix domain-containing protein [Chloroflexota bacterium]
MSEFRDQSEIGEQIVRLRQQRGWDQEALGRHLGLDQSAVSRLERGQRGLSAFELYELGRIFGATPESILIKNQPEAALLRAGQASDETVAKGLDILERAVRQYFGAEELARRFINDHQS